MPYEDFETPYDEDCVQVSRDKDYLPAMRAEHNRLKSYLETRFPCLSGYFSIKSHGHDFGTYLSLRYHGTDEEIGHIEENYPATWGESAIFPFEGRTAEEEITLANALDA